MGWFSFQRNSAGCCCGAQGNTCVLTADDFNRPDDADVGPKWIDPAGAAIVNQAVNITVNNTQVIAQQGNPDGPYTAISVSFRLHSASSTGLVFLGWATDSSYLYARVSQTAIAIGQTGVSETSKSVSLVPGTVYQLFACYNGTKLLARVNGTEVILSGLTAPGTKHGFGVGTATVTFDNFSATKITAVCTGCAETFPPIFCPSCVQNAAHPYWTVTFAGFTNAGHPDCLHCGRWNGLWILGPSSNLQPPCGRFQLLGGGAGTLGLPHPCEPELVVPPDNDWAVFVRPAHNNPTPPLPFSDDHITEARAVYLSFQRHMVFVSAPTPPNKVDCDAIDGTSLPLVHNDGTFCNGGTCVIAKYFP